MPVLPEFGLGTFTYPARRLLRMLMPKLDTVGGERAGWHPFTWVEWHKWNTTPTQYEYNNLKKHLAKNHNELFVPDRLGYAQSNGGHGTWTDKYATIGSITFKAYDTGSSSGVAKRYFCQGSYQESDNTNPTGLTTLSPAVSNIKDFGVQCSNTKYIFNVYFKRL